MGLHKPGSGRNDREMRMEVGVEPTVIINGFQHKIQEPAQCRPAETSTQQTAARTEAEVRCRARTRVRKVRHLGPQIKGGSSAVSALIQA